VKINKVQAISCTCKKKKKMPPYVQTDPVEINRHLLFPPKLQAHLYHSCTINSWQLDLNDSQAFSRLMSFKPKCCTSLTPTKFGQSL
jgi:hypothetical protein